MRCLRKAIMTRGPSWLAKQRTMKVDSSLKLSIVTCFAPTKRFDSESSMIDRTTWNDVADNTLGWMGLVGKLPSVAGGTGFYIDVLVGRIALPDVPVNIRNGPLSRPRSSVPPSGVPADTSLFTSNDPMLE